MLWYIVHAISLALLHVCAYFRENEEKNNPHMEDEREPEKSMQFIAWHSHYIGYIMEFINM